MNAASRPVQFLLNGIAVKAGDVAPTRTVLDYLREDQRCVGTKEGCAEGDCGACTVVVGELVDDALQLRAVNACIQFVPMLDGKALFTVEYLRGRDRSLHPVQQAMVDCHGSQCGFCTPGFIMSLWNCYVDHAGTDTRPDRTELATALSGNLCRCTGYRPIIDAGEAMFTYPAVALDRASIEQQLRDMRSSESLNLSHGSITYHAPRQLAELTALRERKPDCTLLAGCTDIGLWVNKQFRDLGDIVYVCSVDELKTIKHADTHLRIGAAVSLSDAYAAMTRHYPQLQEMWERFASVPIRNAGTLGGNVANGSPIGDSMPWLIALCARVVLTSSRHSRTIDLQELYVDYQVNSMSPEEIVEAIELPLPAPGLVFRTYKLSKRYDSDISAVCAAFALYMDGERIITARVAFGGMAAIPRRASACEAALAGKLWTESTAQAAMAALGNDFTPLDDMRASANYRSRTAANLLYRFFLETRADNALPASRTSVFDFARQESPV
ncbi:MAG: xanthine dehydrogenase small subunit [Granulosicoccus sp.]|nr:xanthine dehydrogenase small subunit [Granulosicoccus sp.]